VAKKTISGMFKLIKDSNVLELASCFELKPESLDEIGQGHRAVLDRTPLIYAIQIHNYDAAHRILDFGPDLNYLMPVAVQGCYSALTYSLFHCGWDKSVFDRIVGDDKLAIDDFGVMGQNALILATKHWKTFGDHHDDILRQLLKNGADPNARSVDGGMLKDRSSAIEIAQTSPDFPPALLALMQET